MDREPVWGTLSTHNQWRCSGHIDGRRCYSLLGIADAEHRGVFVKRRDLEVFIYDIGGSGIMIKCRFCGRENWLFSEDVSQEDKNSTIKHHDKASF